MPARRFGISSYISVQSKQMAMNTTTLNLIEHFEGLHDGDLTKIGLQPKMDPVGIWTEGWGRAMIDPTTKKFLKGKANAAKSLKYQTIHTREEADQALQEDLKQYEIFAANALGSVTWEKLNENQKGALVSFTYNCGVGKPPYKIWTNVAAYINNSMSKKDLIAYWQTSVIKSGGKILPGLVKRRAAEPKLFFS